MQAPRFRWVDALLLVIVLAVAAGGRIWYLATFHALLSPQVAAEDLLHVQDPWPRLPLPPDTEMRGRSQPNELDALVHNRNQHGWFGSLAPFAGAEEQTAHVSPGYPWLISLLAKSPIDLGPLDRSVRWFQGWLGTLTAGLYFLFARRAFGSRIVATVAGLLCALHPFWIINTAELNDGVLTTFLLAGCLYLGTTGGQSGGPLTSFLYGLGLAMLALVQAAMLPFTFVAWVWFLYRCRKLPRGWLCALLVVLGYADGLIPWTLRNVWVHGELVPIVDSAGLHLYMGNNPRATGGTLPEHVLLQTLAESRGEEPGTTAEQLASLPQPQRDRELGAAALQEVQRNPGKTLERRLWAGLSFLFGRDWFATSQLVGGESKTPGWPGWFLASYPALLAGSLLGMLLLAGLGWRWTHGFRFEAMPSSLAVIWIPLPYLLSHAGNLSGPRLPLDGVLLCYAAFALTCWLPMVRRMPEPAEETDD